MTIGESIELRPENLASLVRRADSRGERRVDTIMLSGNGGQNVHLVPSLDLIVAATGVAFFVDSPVNQMLAEVLLPALLRDESSGDRR